MPSSIAPIAEPLGFESYNATLSKAAALFTLAARVIRGVINSCANQFPARYAQQAFSLTLYWLLSGGKILVYLRGEHASRISESEICTGRVVLMRACVHRTLFKRYF
jgi:hypothetical protein